MNRIVLKYTYVYLNPFKGHSGFRGSDQLNKVPNTANKEFLDFFLFS
jgi:hypothetical protein